MFTTRSRNGVKLVDIDCPKKKSLEAIVHTFRAVNQAKRLGADLVHIHAIGPALMVPYAKLLGMRVVFTHHGPDYDRDKWGRAAKMVLKLGERCGCKFADDVIVISDVIRKLIERKYGRTRRMIEKLMWRFYGCRRKHSGLKRLLKVASGFLFCKVHSLQPIGIYRILERDFTGLVIQYVILDKCGL